MLVKMETKQRKEMQAVVKERERERGGKKKKVNGNKIFKYSMHSKEVNLTILIV